ncbi:hypothetical protein Sru01_61770 [Sphaerisporangium rufum]|uniref:Ferritin-like diiron domain-containing protein n=1 Tax=Sphaerisporangium rufum TaxID=1381558 RepID=A0A919V8B5_9ACTN|nr:ferritin family protein [Sphaerisporangium rufum]GII81195.1 hypothetical protein Sru01_61770 [Sphaerisporangium rufum]
MDVRRFTGWRAGFAALGLAAAVAATAAGTATRPRAEIDPATRRDITEAVQDEALAHAKYLAYAAQAGRENLPEARRLFEGTARTEFREHLTEQAGLIGLVGDNAANLRAAIAGEDYEATVMYPEFAARAKAAGDRAASRLFTEISADEARHRDHFRQALRAVTEPRSGATVPTLPKVEPVAIPAGRPKVTSTRTLRDLRAAMRGESFAWAKYTLWADRARATGRRDVAELFDRAARMELTEHFAEEARLAGLVGDTRANLRDAITGETDEGTRTYPGYARKASAAGDRAAAALLTEIGQDELRHAAAFSRVLSGLGAAPRSG